jgi:hypothetical protein
LLTALTAGASQQQDLLMRMAHGVRGTAVSYVAPTNGLVSYWSFDGNANDNYGTNNGTAVNATLTNGLSGSANTAYYFNGTSARITLTGITSASTNHTIAMWVKANNNANADRVLFDTAVGRTVFCWRMLSVAPTNTVIHYDAQSATYKGSYTTPQDGEWHHLALVMNKVDSETIHYVDGVAVFTNAFTYAVNVGGATTLGSRNNGALYFFSGSMDNARYYSAALTSAQITQLYNAEKP